MQLLATLKSSLIHLKKREFKDKVLVPTDLIITLFFQSNHHILSKKVKLSLALIVLLVRAQINFIKNQNNLDMMQNMATLTKESAKWESKTKKCLVQEPITSKMKLQEVIHTLSSLKTPKNKFYLNLKHQIMLVQELTKTIIHL